MLAAEMERDQGVLRIAPGTECQEISVGANVTALAFGAGTVYAGLGDGRVVAIHTRALRDLARHQGAVTALCVDGGSVVSAGQDGRVLRLNEAEPIDITTPKPDWITHVSHSQDGKRVLVVAGKRVEVVEDGQVIARIDDFPSTVSGAQFYNAGKSVAISHYNGISLWEIERFAKPEVLAWAGSVTGVSVSPDGRYVAGTTQDREVHVWDFVTGKDFRLGGYQRKVKAVGWTTDKPYLYSTGADVLVAWSLAAEPGTIPPQEIGYAFSETVSAIIPHCDSRAMPAGFTSGSILLGKAEKATAKIIRAPSGAAITALAPAADDSFCFGTADGKVGLFRVNTA